MRVDWLASMLMLCLTSGAAWAAQEEQEAQAPLQCGTVAYPPEAVAYSLEGTTTVQYTVTADGRVVEPTVKRSSGWKMLDEATLEILAGCRLTRTPAAEALAKPQVIQYVWSLDGEASRQAPVPGSCAGSDRFKDFRPLDTNASGPDGILVRAMIGANGDPYYVKAEPGDAPADLAGLAVAYLRSCRFALPPGERSPKDGAIFGRVLLN